MDTLEVKKDKFLKLLGEKTAWDVYTYENILKISEELEWTQADTESLALELDSENLINLEQGGMASLTPAGRTHARRA